MNRAEALRVLNGLTREEIETAAVAAAERMATAKQDGTMDALIDEDEARRPLVPNVTTAVVDLCEATGTDSRFSPLIQVGAALAVRTIFECLESQPTTTTGTPRPE